MEDTKQRVRDFLAKHLRNTKIGDDEHIFNSGYVNSLFAMQLVMFLEKEFGLKLQGHDLSVANFASITAIAELISRKRAGATRPAPATRREDTSE